MLFMVVERFPPGALERVGARFRERGRLLPEGVTYAASWVETAGGRCFQVMEAPDRAALDAWIARWSDLVDFEVYEVLASADFWRARDASAGGRAPDRPA